MSRSEGEKKKLIRKLLSGAIPEVSVSLIASIAGCKVQAVRDLRREMRDSEELPERKDGIESGIIHSQGSCVRPEASDRKIAELIGCEAKEVGVVRRELRTKENSAQELTDGQWSHTEGMACEYTQKMGARYT